MDDLQTMYDAILFGIRGQGGPEWECTGGPTNGRYCAIGVAPKSFDAWGRTGVMGELTVACMRAHNTSAHEVARGDDGEFLRLWEPRMRAVAETFGLRYEDDKFAAFKAKLLEPLTASEVARL